MRTSRILVLVTVCGVLAVGCQTSDVEGGATAASVTSLAPATTTTSVAAPPTSGDAAGSAVRVVAPPRRFVTGVPDIAPDVYQVWNTSADVVVRSAPGGGTAVAELSPSARDITTTGRRAEAGDTFWVEIELDGDRTGWIPVGFLVHQITELAAEAPATYIVTGLASGETLDVRRNAGRDHPVVALLERAVAVDTTGRRAEVRDSLWREVEYADGRFGWVEGRFLIPEVVSIASVDPAVYRVVGVATGSKLEVHRGPGDHTDAIATLEADATGVESTGRRAVVLGTIWRQIELDDGALGWVESTFVEVET